MVPGPYAIHPHNPVVVVSAYGEELAVIKPVGSRAERLATTRLFAASWSYHQSATRLAMVALELCGDMSRVREAALEVMVIHRIVEGN